MFSLKLFCRPTDAQQYSTIKPHFTEQWRAEHWRSFYRALSQKTLDWENEHEQRLIHVNNTGNGCTFTYDFKSLKGIIFGINTPFEKKTEIINIIKGKIQAQKNNDFKFYQAFYAKESGTIEKIELTRINQGLNVTPAPR